MVLVQKWPFFRLFFLGNIGQENLFYDILERKNACLGYKKKKFKKSKNWRFSKGPKMAIFPTFLLSNKGQKKVFYDILERNNAFLGYKNKNFKKSKNWHFSKVANPWFSSNNGHSFNFFSSGEYRPEKNLLRYSTTRKRVSTL